MVPSASTAPRWSTVTYRAMLRTKSMSCSTTISVARRLISWGWRRVTSRPLNWIVPAVGLSWPVRSLKSVLLPPPLGPITQRSSPRLRVKSTELTARSPPNSFTRPRAWSTTSFIRELRRWGPPSGGSPDRAFDGRHQAPGKEQDDHHEDRAERDGRVGDRRSAEVIREELNDERPDHGPVQRAPPADHHPDDHQRRLEH